MATITTFDGAQGSLFPDWNYGILPVTTKQLVGVVSQYGLLGYVTALTAVSVVPVTAFSVRVTWDAIATPLCGGSMVNWSITNNTGVAVSILSASMDTTSSTLIVTSEHTQGGDYTLHIPASALVSAQGYANAASNWDYIGIGQAPALYSAAFINQTLVYLTYSEAMDTASATDSSKYSIPGLTIYTVAALSPTLYAITTSTMNPSTVYTLTVTGTVDRAQNAVA